MKTPVTVIGGGLVGSLLAVYLRRRDYPVTVHEARPDPREPLFERIDGTPERREPLANVPTPLLKRGDAKT